LLWVSSASASFAIVEVLPNTQDDTNLESISIKNIWELPLSLSWYTLADLKKEYLILSNEILDVWGVQLFLRPETKLILNNSDEEIFLYDSENNLVDSIEYSSSEKDVPLVFDELENIEDIENTWDSPWFTNQWTWSLSWSGEVLTVEDIKVVSEDLKVKFDLQRPSYITQSWSSDTYICDSWQDECKVNFNFEPSFEASFRKWDYDCEIDFGWVWESEKNKCNPNTVIFPEGETSISINLIHKDLQIVQAERTIHIIFDRSLPCFEEKIKKSKTAKLALRKPNIIVQSGLTGQGRNFYCKKKPCKFNLNYEKIHSAEACFWDFWPWVASSQTTRERCNPWYVEMPEWLYSLSLRVYEKSFPSNQQTLTYYIHNIPEPTEDETLEIVQQSFENIWEKRDIDLEKEVQEDMSDELVIQDIHSKILLQWKIWNNKTLSWSTLTCSDADRCYVNFSSTWSKIPSEYSVAWMDNEVVFSNKSNPKWVWFWSGSHAIEYSVSYSWAILSSDSFMIHVNTKQLDDWGEKETQISSEPALFTNIEEKIVKKKTAKDFTQNYLPLKYDGLRISGKAPLWSTLTIYSWERTLWSVQTDEKWKYRFISKDFLAWEYSFSTIVKLSSWEERLIENSWDAYIKTEDRAFWFMPKKISSKKSSSSSSASTTAAKLIVKRDSNPEIQVQEEMSFWVRIFLIAIIALSIVIWVLHLIYTSSSYVTTHILHIIALQFSTRQKVCLIL